ncbi:probable N-acetyltransferase HLS1 [Malania oleifera]|uniref:probable N-acetyltransferase HLS1 n=1 Tax=Malania oleifera TaxID=397392 RepID=UPI0025AE584D|nr:probable N-acetyltransferase HLS1 [Malania oleifera]
MDMEEKGGVSIREYDPSRDSGAVEAVERRCEVGNSAPGKMSLCTHLLGDPLCRIRHSPPFLMLVAEVGQQEKEIVGMIRGCIKTVTCGQTLTTNNINNGNNTITKPPKLSPVSTKLAYILGLRVSPSHRRMCIGLKLVIKMEEWFKQNGAEYSYVATENDNAPSLNLFIQKCSYSKFRTPSILVQPVFAHRFKLPNRVTIIRLTPTDSETLYRRRFSTTEFFPHDIGAVLKNRLSLGTYVAVPAGSYSAESWPGSAAFLADPPESWAVLSIWNTKEVFTLELKGACFARRMAVKATRVVDTALPWLKIPSLPDVFRPFGLHFLYGVGGEGPRAGRMVKALCAHAHNLARGSGCGVVVTEVSGAEPLKLAIPHWKRLSCAEDLWCMKRLVEDCGDGPVGDWTKSPAGPSIFVDPREF